MNGSSEELTLSASVQADIVLSLINASFRDHAMALDKYEQVLSNSKLAR